MAGDAAGAADDAGDLCVPVHEETQEQRERSRFALSAVCWSRVSPVDYLLFQGGIPSLRTLTTICQINVCF